MFEMNVLGGTGKNGTRTLNTVFVECVDTFLSKRLGVVCKQTTTGKVVVCVCVLVCIVFAFVCSAEKGYRKFALDH